MKILAAAAQKTLHRTLQEQALANTNKGATDDDAKRQNQLLEEHFHAAINSSTDSAESEMKLREIHQKLIKNGPPPLCP